MTLPFASCICPTFGRPPHFQHLLEEAVESFRRQDYPQDRCELVILNDCTEQDLRLPGTENAAYSLTPFSEYRWGNIRIVRCAFRFETLGDKYNAMCNLASGDVLLPWEDDDISLPHRISQAVKMLGEAEYWKPPQVWYYPKGGKPVWKHPVGVRHHASIFTRQAWQKMGGYPAISGPQDAVFDALLRKHCRVAPEGDLSPLDWNYAYRWGVSPCHLSAFADTQAVYASQRGVPGTWILRPHWREDYVSLVRESYQPAAPLSAT